MSEYLTEFIVSQVLTGIACGIIACRADKMLKGTTDGRVFLQHAGLGVALFASLVIQFTQYRAWAGALIAGGVVFFFAMSRKRWERAAPDGTTKPGELGPPELNR